MADLTQLAVRIVDALREAKAPMAAKDLATLLQQKHSIAVTKKDLNPLLYGELASQVQKDEQNRWSVIESVQPQRKKKTTAKKQSASSPEGTASSPSCPGCGKPMVLRAATRGHNAGGQFYGCRDYPRCKATRDLPHGFDKAERQSTSPLATTSPRPLAAEETISRPRTKPIVDDPVDATSPDLIHATSGPKCPKCGADMQSREARRGKNAGGKFYGCTQWPNCKGTLEFVDDGTPRGVTPHGGKSLANHPRRITPFASTSITQANYFECIALPVDAISPVIIDALSTSHIRALSQWQLDLPPVPESPATDQPTWLPVVEKILKRGRAVPLSPQLEVALRSLSGCPELSPEEWKQSLEAVATGGRPQPAWKDGFGSEEEKLFFETVLPSIASPDILGWVQRQVAMDGLVYTEDYKPTGRRVDFLISHPSGLQVVVEIDGAQHNSQLDADECRDAELVAAGYQVIRIPVDELREGRGHSLSELKKCLAGVKFPDAVTTHRRFLTLVRRAHQLQMALWYMSSMTRQADVEYGPSRVAVVLDTEFDQETTRQFATLVMDDLNELIHDVALLYGEAERCAVFKVARDSTRSDSTVCFKLDYDKPKPGTVLVRDVYLPLTISTEVAAVAPATACDVPEATCQRLLRRIFGFGVFREGQYPSISRCLGGKDAIVLLPTGGGKSVAFQLGALLRPGVCIIIEPILSLIEDQIENLRAFGLDRVCQITSAVERGDRRSGLESLARGEYQFCYVTPERFQDQKFRDSLRVLTSHTAVSLVAIDEAHCVSEWGHDFRPAYLNIARISRDYCARDGIPPPLMALTGTASRAVLKDVQRELQIADFESIITPATFDRPELHFQTIPCRSNEKILRMRGLLELLPRQFNHTTASFFECRGKETHSGLVFCPHVGGDFGVVRVSKELAKSLNRDVPCYSGSEPKGFDAEVWRKEKTRIAKGFKRNSFPLMTCTKAFGMGIDKPNIRYTVHFGLPASIESFYQEAGRAGRDRRSAQCKILFSNDMPQRTKQLLNPSVTVDQLHAEMKTVTWDNADDITRVLWFHANSFAGVEADYRSVEDALDQVGSLTKPRDAIMKFASEDRTVRERALHRLLSIGVVADYTVDFSASQFRIRLTGCDKQEICHSLYRYIAAYQRGQAKVTLERLLKNTDLSHKAFVRRAARELISFVYEVIERSRRQALSEMLSLCEQCPDEKAIRRRLLTYLGTSGFTTRIDELLEAADGGLKEALVLLEEIRSAIDASQLRGESGRALESYPDHTGLRLVRAVSEVMSASPDADTVSGNVEACMRFGQEKYGLSPVDLGLHVISAARIAGDARPEAVELIVQGMIKGVADKRLAARMIVENLPSTMSGPGVSILIDGLNSRLVRFLEQ
jgi:ATP-dependent DNA helicase RecQ